MTEKECLYFFTCCYYFLSNPQGINVFSKFPTFFFDLISKRSMVHFEKSKCSMIETQNDTTSFLPLPNLERNSSYPIPCRENIDKQKIGLASVEERLNSSKSFSIETKNAIDCFPSLPNLERFSSCPILIENTVSLNMSLSCVEESKPKRPKKYNYLFSIPPTRLFDEAYGGNTDDSTCQLTFTDNPFVAMEEIHQIERARKIFQHKCFFMDDCIAMERENAYLRKCTPERRLSNDWYWFEDMVDIIDLKTSSVSLHNVKDVTYDNIIVKTQVENNHEDGGRCPTFY